MDYSKYDTIIVTFSGGKDSTACFLHLLEEGVNPSKIELWHHDIDGRGETFMDWEVTPDYCRKFAYAFGVPIYFSWKQGGFEKELNRENDYTAPIYFETPDRVSHTKRSPTAKRSTRKKFPQVSPDLSVRWCSAYLKIDVCKSAIANQRRFDHKKVLVISGERGEESPNRARYHAFEKDKADNRFEKTYQKEVTAIFNGKKKAFLRNITIGKNDRHVDRSRPIKDWTESMVWNIIQRFKVRVHPCYYLGWSRCSCKFCIFGNADQMASAVKISPKQGKRIMAYEDKFGTTIKRNGSLEDLIQSGKPYAGTDDSHLVQLATSGTYSESIFMEEWFMPAGAFGNGCGPN